MSMMYVVLKLPDSRMVYVPPGSVIGRLISSPIPIDHPNISEAHVLVTHRGDSLWMVGLQQRVIKVHGDRSRSNVRLAVGQRLGLAEGYEVEVVKIVLPERLPVVKIRPCQGAASWRNLGSLGGHEFYSITQEPALVAGRRVDSLCQLASGSDSWVVYSEHNASVPIEDVEELAIGDWLLKIEWVSSEHVSTEKTIQSQKHFFDCKIRRVGGHVEVVPIDDGVHLEPIQFKGQQGRILVAMMQAGRPTGWQKIAADVWEDWSNLDAKRRESRWYLAVHRLRKKFMELNIDPDTVYKHPEFPGRYGLRESCLQKS